MQRSKSGFQTLFTAIQLILFLLHFIFVSFCTAPNYFYAFDFCISNTNTQRNKHTFKKIIYSQLCVQIPFALSNFLLCEVFMLSRNPASLHKHVEWNILVLLQSILCRTGLPDAHFPLNFLIISPCFLPAKVDMF